MGEKQILARPFFTVIIITKSSQSYNYKQERKRYIIHAYIYTLLSAGYSLLCTRLLNYLYHTQLLYTLIPIGFSEYAIVIEKYCRATYLIMVATFRYGSQVVYSQRQCAFQCVLYILT